MIVFYGYAEKKDGKFLGYVPNGIGGKRFYKHPKFPVVCAFNNDRVFENEGGRVVRVRLVMEECEVK